MKKIIMGLVLSLMMTFGMFAADWVKYGTLEGAVDVYFDVDATKPFDIKNESIEYFLFLQELMVLMGRNKLSQFRDLRSQYSQLLPPYKIQTIFAILLLIVFRFLLRILLLLQGYRLEIFRRPKYNILLLPFQNLSPLKSAISSLNNPLSRYVFKLVTRPR